MYIIIILKEEVMNLGVSQVTLWESKRGMKCGDVVNIVLKCESKKNNQIIKYKIQLNSTKLGEN